MTLVTFRHRANEFGLMLATLVVLACTILPYNGGPDPSGALGIILLAAILRRRVRQRTRLLLVRTPPPSKVALMAHVQASAWWLILPMASACLAGQAGFERGLFTLFLALTFSLGAATGEVKRCQKRRDQGLEPTKPEGWGWTVVGIVLSVILSVSLLFGFSAFHSVLQSQPSKPAISAHDDAVLAEVSRVNKASMEKSQAELNETGEVHTSAAELNRRAEEQLKLAGQLENPVLRVPNEVTMRMQLTVRHAADGVAKAHDALMAAGGPFDPTHLTTHEAILARQRLVTDLETASLAYRARIENLHSLLESEIAHSSLTAQQQQTYVEATYRQVGAETLREIAANRLQYTKLCDSVLRLLDSTRSTRQKDEAGHPLFAQQAEADAYNEALGRAERLKQEYEAILQRLFAAAAKQKT